MKYKNYKGAFLFATYRPSASVGAKGAERQKKPHNKRYLASTDHRMHSLCWKLTPRKGKEVTLLCKFVLYCVACTIVGEEFHSFLRIFFSTFCLTLFIVRE